MPRIPQETIDQIVSETNIVDVISESVPLRKAGNNFKGLCPFHGEKTPSFVVSPQKQIFHCFGCGEGGGVVQFLMKKERMDFRRAIEFLAGRLSLVLPESEEEHNPQKDYKKKLYKVNQYANWFFKNQLQSAKPAQEYLKKRHLAPEIWEKFQLGYGPDSFEQLIPFLEEKKIPLSMAETVGLIKKSNRSQGYYDFYRDRLIFPISDASGSIIGFGGRILKNDQKQAKYINSPESPVYRKSYELYGFYENKAEIFKEGKAILVEGYMDVLACVQLGYANAVAPLGTSLTNGQIQKLKRYDLGVILMFDGDSAGQKACLKAVDLCLQEGLHPQVAILPTDKDPGDFLGQDSDIIGEIIKNAPYALDWILTQTFQKASASPTGQVQAIEEIRTWIQKLPDKKHAGPYWQKAEQFFGLPLQEGNKVIENTSQFAMTPQSFSGQLSIEEILILLFVRQPHDFPENDLLRFGQHFDDPSLKDLAENLQNFVKNHETFDLKDAISHLPGSLQKQYSRILAREEQYKNLVPKDCFDQFGVKSKKRQLKRLSAKIAEAELKRDDTLKMQLLVQKQNLLKSQ